MTAAHGFRYLYAPGSEQNGASGQLDIEGPGSYPIFGVANTAGSGALTPADTSEAAVDEGSGFSDGNAPNVMD